jgi:hypothetical protein
MIAGANPSISSEPRAASSTNGNSASSKYSISLAGASTKTVASVSAPSTEMTSSILPSEVSTVDRTVCVMVSPVLKAAATIAVPSINPATIRPARPGRL